MRKPVVLGVIAVSLALIAGLWYLAHPPSKPPVRPEETATTQAKPVSRNVLPAPVQTPTQEVATPQPSAPRQPVAPPAPARALAPIPGASAFTRSLIGSLTNLDLSHGPITPERAQAWKQDYDKLIKAGAESVPAIREFLAQNLDVNFQSLPNGNELGFSSMRLAMFDALRQIGGSDAEALSADVMQTTTSPAEIAILAGNLNSMAPGQYGDAALTAARIALDNPALDPSKVDVAPLFQVLQQLGGVNALGDLQTAAGKWNFYAPIALANLPDGGGIPLLAQMAQNAGGSFSSSSSMALQMLAQLAPQYPDAANALISQLQTLPAGSRAWMNIASVLGGQQTYFSASYLNTPVPPTDANLTAVHMAATDQNWQSVNVSANWTPQQIQSQLNLINQIIAANPAAAPAFQQTQTALAARLGK